MVVFTFQNKGSNNRKSVNALYKKGKPLFFNKKNGDIFYGFVMVLVIFLIQYVKEL